MCLQELVKERFPDTTWYITDGGDYFENVELELRQGDKKMKYRPYELFNKSDSFEDVLEETLEQWKSIIYQDTK